MKIIFILLLVLLTFGALLYFWEDIAEFFEKQDLGS